MFIQIVNGSTLSGYSSADQVLLDVITHGITYGVALGIAITLAWFLVKYGADRLADILQIKWQGKETRKNKELQSILDHEQTIIKEILDSFYAQKSASQSVKIEGVRQVWKKVLETRTMGAVPLRLYSILNKKELVNPNTKITELIKSISIDDTLTKISKVQMEVEEYRPFIGEKLWLLFQVYTIIIGRATFKLRDDMNKGKIIYWYDDDYFKSIIESVYSADEKQKIITKEFGSLNIATGILEERIKFEIHKIIAGEQIIEESQEDIKKYARVIGQLTNDEWYKEIILKNKIGK